MNNNSVKTLPHLKYFSCPESNNYSRYGLLDFKTNRFIIISNSYATLKSTQLLFTKFDFPPLTLVPVDMLTNPKEYLKKQLEHFNFEIVNPVDVLYPLFEEKVISEIPAFPIDNDNCHLVGLGSNLNYNFALDFHKLYTPNSLLIYFKNSDPQFDFKLQQKVFFIYFFSKLIDEITIVANAQINQYQMNVNESLDVFQQMFKMQSKIDLSDFIQSEKNLNQKIYKPFKEFSEYMKEQLFSLNLRDSYLDIALSYQKKAKSLYESPVIQNHKSDSSRVISQMYHTIKNKLNDLIIEIKN